MSTRKRILVVDDHPLVRSGLCQAIAATAELEVCGEAESWREVLEKILASNRRLQTQMPPVLITGEAGTGKSSLARRLGSRIRSRTS